MKKIEEIILVKLFRMTKIYSEFTQEELNDIINLEQMKENPNYKNYSQRLIQRNNLDFKKINEDVISKDDNNSLVPKNNTENIIYTKKKNGEERQNNRLKLYDEELDNSSFSLDEKTPPYAVFQTRK